MGGTILSLNPEHPEIHQANVGVFGFPGNGNPPRESWGKDRHVQGAELVKGLGKERHIRMWP